MSGDADLAGVGELFADRTRSRILLSLLGGRELAAGLTERERRVAALVGEGARVVLVARREDALAEATRLGYAEADPTADNSTPEGKAQNRRIEFVVK